MSVSEEPQVPMSVSEEPQVPMSVSEEPQVPMSVSGQPVAVASREGAPRFSHIGAAAIVFGGLAATGVLVGVLWSFLAPGVHGAIADTRDNGRVFVHLGNQADNFFIGTTLLVGMAAVVAVIAAAAAWQWRAHRGPMMVGALTLGSLACSAVAAGVGAVLVRLRYGALDIAGASLDAGHRIKYVVQAPAVFYGHTEAQIAVTLALAPCLAAVVYMFCVVACARDDLDAWPPAPVPEYRAPVLVPPTEGANSTA
ncbi:DUF2567 domain-containing protein [Mycobacteroides abscessus]|nr:DUF2567 domain-containing protein [Mycobacteroides abscessus]ALM16920.1 hypothetical protein AOY11_12310 [Mycobacteroides abscessus]AMU46126.1 hypothetical protein A3O00_13440 [Mycobacteroides abscessus]AMU51021.1 hypothetical protein A3O01_13370 [Mycobacteroides abscessus]ANO09704.1 hypothetical protein BAB76_13380 [Mycobacteroides abscessus]ANO19461.1 hypothetical protein BAB78_13570 [Mycobacteroides abscessus]